MNTGLQKVQTGSARSGFTANHVYMVVDYDASTNRFLIINPHNITNTSATYAMWIDGGTLLRNFSEAVIATV